MGNNIPHGYKATALGIIPQEWEVKKLGEVGKLLSGLTYTPSNIQSDGILVLRSSNIQNGVLAFDDNVYVNVSSYTPVKAGDILICVRNGSQNLIGKTALITHEAEGCAFGAFMAVFRSPISKYVFYLLGTELYRKYIFRNLGATINSINGSDLKKFRFPFPPLAEQRKIAEVLGVWDEAIEKQARLIEKLALRKRALMQRLLSAKLRLPGFSEPWKKVKLGDVASIKTGNKNNEDKIANGQYPFFVRSSIVERINTYSYDGEAILIPGEGKIGEIIHYINGKFDYHQRVYKISDFSNCSGLFLYYYLMYFFGKQAINNSVKACVDSLRLSTFTNMTIIHPPISEQTAIAEVLTAADREIELAKEKLERLRRQKRGLMQQLLTGKKRIKY